VVELGRPQLLATVLLSCSFVVMLFRAALRRGRDSFYPAAGSAALVALLITAFGNDGLFESPVLIIAGVIIGLAVGQSRSRTV
jgi:chromate transport protein ChrA